jgi:hypothetical protein
MSVDAKKETRSLSEKIEINKNNLKVLIKKRDNLNILIENLSHKIQNQERALNSEKKS